MLLPSLDLRLSGRRRLRWPATWLSTTVIAALLTTAVAGAAPDDEFEGTENATAADRKSEVVDRSLYYWFFGDDSDAVPEKRLATFLTRKISVTDRVCRLSEIQKRKLFVAGRGDSKRLLEIFERISGRYRAIKDDLDELNKLQREFELIRRGSRPWFPDAESLFRKTADSLLTKEQLVRYKPLRIVYRHGGVIGEFPGTDNALWVNLSETSLVDSDLAAIRDLPGLRMLFIDNTAVTDAGLANLKGLTDLSELGLTSTRVTDAGLANLSGMTKLKSLALAGTELTDAGVEHLTGMTDLQKLWIHETQVTDAGLKKLKRLTNLRVISLNRTRVTPRGIADLTESLPDVTVRP